ncbi:MAG TPA: lipoprotein [Micropepsaceae bacterium]|nr:lipoprotein [Micropepsaceae bacterium]
MIRTRTVSAILLLVLTSGALSACGKKGPLEHPTTSSPSTTATPEADDKDEKQDQGNTTP